jgi:FkbM family methyltransferase
MGRILRDDFKVKPLRNRAWDLYKKYGFLYLIHKITKFVRKELLLLIAAIKWKFKYGTSLKGGRILLDHEPEISEAILEKLHSDTTFFDIGAYVGEYSLALASIPNITVVAFEPDKLAFEHLQMQVQANSFKNITLYNKLISSGEATYFTDSDQSKLVAKDVAGESEKYNLDRLDATQLLRLDLPSPDIIKIDVAGAETDVIKTLAPLLELTTCVSVIIEVHLSYDYSLTPGWNLKEIFEIMNGIGFELTPLKMRGSEIFLQFDKSNE